MNIHLKYLLDESKHTYSNANYNHCSTLLSYKGAVHLAWYSGNYECSDDQCVTLLNLKTGNSLYLEDGSGNPVLFKNRQNRAFILYSCFRKHKNIESKIDKWKYCDIYIRELVGEHLTDRILISNEADHLLGRCAPVSFNGKIYLPLYNELDGRCVIFAGDGSTFEKVKEFGEDEIQPSLYHDGRSFKALSRNFRSKRFFARIHTFDTVGSYDVFDTDIPNVNNSIATLFVNDITFVVFNDSSSHVRKNLSIGYIVDDKFTRVKVLDSYGHYPSIIRHNNELLISYTSYFNTIKLIRFNLDSFLNDCGYCVKMR